MKENLKELFALLKADVEDISLGLKRYIIYDAKGKALTVVKGMRDVIQNKKRLKEEGHPLPLRVERFD